MPGGHSWDAAILLHILPELKGDTMKRITSSQVFENLQGVFVPVATPFNRKGGLDEGRFRSNLQRYSGIGLGGVVVSGSTGEAPYLSVDERLRLIEIAREYMSPPELLIAGTGLESTASTIQLSREAIERGADALLVLPPCYYKPVMKADLLLAHYRTLADSVRRPVLVYSIPQFSGISIDVATIARLAEHPNIAGLKESSGDVRFMRMILSKVKGKFRVLAGSATLFLQALRAGAAGAVLGPANFAPQLNVALYEAFRKRQWKRAAELQQRLVPLAIKITGPYGVPGVKAALDLSGYAGGDPRPPLLPVNGQARRVIRQALHESSEGLAF